VAVSSLCLAGPVTADGPATPRPFGPGERADFRISYLHLLAGRASLSVETAPEGPLGAWRFVATARSQGLFAWLFRFRVEDRTVATWDAGSGCSLGIEKRLREGKARRDQVVAFDHAAGAAIVSDSKVDGTRFEVEPCVLDVLSALFVVRIRGVPEKGEISLPLFDNGKHYRLAVAFVKRDRLDLPPPFGKDAPTIVVEPRLVEGTGLFVRKGRLTVWLTDDTRRVPVRMKSAVAIGSVGADLEAYTPPTQGPWPPAAGTSP
jgi:hypothetical protein